MVSASPAVKLAMSSLEEMLESLRQTNHESDKPKDLPPVLPSRPITRRRLPSARRSLPTGFKIEDSGIAMIGECDKREEDGNGEEKDADSMNNANVSKGEKPRYTVNDAHTFGYCINKVGDTGNTEKYVWQHIINIQKSFRGNRARRYFCELKKGAIIMQTFLRAHLDHIHYRLLSYGHMKSKSRHNSTNMLAMQGILPDEQYEQILPSTLQNLQRRVFKVEASLEQKDEENALLKEQLSEFKERCMKNDVKMQSMEEICKKQITSVQVSLATCTKSPNIENRANHPGRSDLSKSPHAYNNEETLLRSQTPSCTPECSSASEFFAKNTARGNRNSVNTSDKEFERKSQTFDGDAKSLVAVRGRHSNFDKELKRLKHKLGSWKQGYKIRLREVRIKLHNLGTFECRRRWSRRNIS